MRSSEITICFSLNLLGTYPVLHPVLKAVTLPTEGEQFDGILQVTVSGLTRENKKEIRYFSDTTRK